MDHNPPIISSNHFDYDNLLLDDDELLHLISSVFPATTPQIDDVSAVLAPSIENQLLSQDSTVMVSNPIHSSQQQEEPSQHINVACQQPVEFKSTAPTTTTRSKCAGKKKSNSKAVEIERKRRQDMTTLYHDLRSLLPPEYLKGKRSTSDLLHEAMSYINTLQKSIKGLNDSKDELLRITPAESSSINNHNSNQNCNVKVKACKEGFIEVIFSTRALYDDDEKNQNFRLSKVLHILNKEGLDVINCISSRVHDDMVHTIQAQVDDGRGIDLCLLQQTLTDCGI
ncbi:transcription factor bHLH118-like [Beta vulgaris subsp. vulgaris]|uniref:transcription factor bHLH118-like n=1 Tax=Beta vulgaris subsp. vulgaris TaxID=3555 RepID=UPI00053FB202|nr:transcription factor bHLH118-like [Beta vulgaris subsp. vulgaris]